MYISKVSGGMLQKILMPQESFWCNLRLDARLETIKWLFLDSIFEVMNIINSRGGCRYTPYTPPGYGPVHPHCIGQYSLPYTQA